MQAANLTLSFDLHCTNINFDEEFRAYQEVVEMEKNKRPIGYIALLSNKGHNSAAAFEIKDRLYSLIQTMESHCKGVNYLFQMNRSYQQLLNKFMPAYSF